MIAFGFAARKKLEAVPRGLQNFAESIVEFINSQFTVGIIGHGGEKYTPLVGTIFFYILIMNLWGQIPGLHSPTANLSTTLALGVIVFVYVQIQGVKANGLGGHLKHFMGPMPAAAPLLLPLEIIGEIIKPFTLAIRLFGNIFGEDVILVVLAGLGITLNLPLGQFLPIQIPIVLLAMLTSFVQAMVFSILTCIYISLVSHHDHEEGHDDHEALHAHATGH